MLFTILTTKSVEDAATALVEAVESNHFGVMQVYDFKKIMKAKGVEFNHECRIFEICQPQQAKNVLDQDMRISTALPCRISIYEQDGQTAFATLKPTHLLGMFNVPNLADTAQEVENSIVEIIKEAALD